MKTLDALLYQWIGEADESRIEGAFRAYYSAAFPSVVRHVQHRTGWDLASAEDIAQEALLRFFERAGRGRRQAGALVSTELARVHALRVGVLDSSCLARWARDVNAMVDAAINFRPPSTDAFADADWRAAAGALSARIVPLQRAGWSLLDEARRNLQWLLRRAGADGVDTPAAGTRAADEDAGAGPDESGIVQFVRWLVRHPPPGDSRALTAEQRFPGVGRFMESVLTVVETLPRLRVPANGLLFEIATTTLLDEIKKRRRKKRGGLDERTANPEPFAGRALGMSAHPLEALADDPHAEPDDVAGLHRGTIPEPPWHAATEMLPLAIDPVRGYEGAQLLERFYEHLRRPVAQAVRALEEARARGRALPEQRRLDSVSGKFSRTMAVLGMMGEGYTQEEVARRTGLSRNQVKYIVESVKEVYVRFAAGEPFEAERQVNREGESHVS
jgi:DNA-directed RNA polymerase specialized sigma24 family protein